MFFFLIKKSFFDAWDNLGTVIVANLCTFVIVVVGTWPVVTILESGSASGLPILILLVPVLFVAGGITSAALSRVADFQRAAWSDIRSDLSAVWKTSLFFGVSLILFFPLSWLGMTYYIGLKNTLGLVAMALLFWISLGVYLSAIWFYPVRNRLDGNYWKLLRKCFLIMFDNLGLSLFSGLIMIPLQMLLWPITAFGGFGPAGVQLYMNDAMRLLMFKYDWLEDHPDARKKEVPWYELLIGDKENVGKRTLKGMIFPWKD